ncbi:MAG: PDZ domain-containing protein, partial [Planctomycetes bacterium]|nr:PDZ domain-containing protein [Planctomycetota bacterium]
TLAYALVATCVGITPAAEDRETLEQRAFRAAVDRVAPGVVRIETVGGGDQVGKVEFGAGPTTGLVIDPDGYVVSSAINFLNAPDSILVRLPDGVRKPARLVATDHSRMLVLLKIETDEPLPVPEAAPEEETRVGQWAIAVGRTFDAQRPNMSVGIVSALDRVWGKAIQTDAAVSPNNYGGPLVDVRGRVLGVLAPLSPQRVTEVAGVEWYDSGIGFAIPAAHVQRIFPRLREGEDLYRGVIGISFPSGNLSTAEPVIAACHPNSPAYESGLKVGDRVVEVEGQETVRASQVKEQLSRRYAGDTVRMVVLRDGKRLERELELVARLEPYEHPFLGVLPVRGGGGTADRPAGVRVRYVYPDGPAREAGVERGDLLVSMGGEAIHEAGDLRRRVSLLKPEDDVELEVRRDEETLRLGVRLGRLPVGLPPEELPPAAMVGERDEGPEVGAIELKVPEFENDAWAYIPDGHARGLKCGLIVWLHGAGQFDWDKLLARWKPHCDRDGLILLAPRSAGGKGWLMREVTLVEKLLNEVNSTYAVDPTRIVLYGHQAGGRLAYLVGFRGRKLVRAVAAADAPLTGRPPENDPLHRLAFYVVRAEKSRHAERIDVGTVRLREMEYPVTVKELGEKPRYLNRKELSELLRWIDMLDRI